MKAVESCPLSSHPVSKETPTLYPFTPSMCIAEKKTTHERGSGKRVSLASTTRIAWRRNASHLFIRSRRVSTIRWAARIAQSPSRACLIGATAVGLFCRRIHQCAEEKSNKRHAGPQFADPKGRIQQTQEPRQEWWR
jgi:hypothetical protein